MYGEIPKTSDIEQNTVKREFTVGKYCCTFTFKFKKIVYDSNKCTL